LPYSNISGYCCVACFLRIASLVWSFITGWHWSY